ncbi:MAG: alpha-hydroxy-acid oxidizing protein [Hyphomonadaceae bacterium]|nr:alpha-hydroxy-acid oxidizing protein [Aquidulcibacter sp.]
MNHYGDYQIDIYGAGLRGALPDIPVDFATLEARATEALSPSIRNYVQGGCGDELTQQRNTSAFEHWGIYPRMMVDCSVRDLSIELFGKTLPSPILMAPVGVGALCVPDGHGDLAAAHASVNTGVPFVASTLSNDPLERVADIIGSRPKFFQLYTPKDPELTASLIGRAEVAGFDAIVITLDTWVTGWRPRDLNSANFPQLRGAVLENYFSDPIFRSRLVSPPEDDLGAAIALWRDVFGKVLTWSDISWFRSMTRLPLVLKGICHPDDARRAIDCGVDAIYCSNHGGRQANGGIAAIDMLPGVVAASGKAPVLFDSGVRSGTDVVKALAMGARAVGIGRPWAYGLALQGATGATHVLRSILAEADLLMAINGYPTIAHLRESGIVRLETSNGALCSA